MTQPRTLVEKIWDEHVVSEDPGAPAVLAIDLHLVHEVTSPQAFTGLRTRGAQVRRPDKTVATADHGTPTTPRGLPDGRHAGGGPDPAARDELRGVRHPDPRLRQRHPGDRPRHRPGAGPDAARHDDRLRRLPHGDARGVRRAGVRDRDERGRDGPRDPDPAPAQAEDLRGPRRRAAEPRRQRQGHHPRPHRPHRHRRRHRPRLRVPRRGDPRAEHGTADDDLQHEHRGRRARRARSPRTRPPSSTSAAAGTPRRARRGTRPSRGGAPSPRDDGAVVRQEHRDRRLRPRADGHLRQQPGHGHPGHRPRAPARGRRGPAGPPRPGARARVHGPDARPGHRRPAGGRRVHRQLHEQPDQRPAPRGERAQGPPRRRGRAPDDRPGLPAGEGPGRARGPPRDLPRRGRRVARGRLLDVHRDERRPADARASTRSARPTATSRAARARAAARSSPARSRLPRAPSPASSPIPARSPASRTW